MTPIAPHITTFFQVRLPIDTQASRHTVDTYAYGFKLLLEFASERLGVAPSDVALEQVDAEFVLAFLGHLQAERGNGPRTRNSRLAAIKSFMRFVEHRVPSALDQVRRVLAIPQQRTDTPLVPHLTLDEGTALLNAPDSSTLPGIRDRAMLHMGLSGGLRVSEIVTLRTVDLNFEGRYAELVIHGKGRKQRSLVLWKEVADALRAWLAVRGDAATPEIFLNARGQAMSRSGYGYMLSKHAKVAIAASPSLSRKRVTPHVLRHTCATNILRATGDIRKVSLWLGHASQRSTEIYLQTDPTEKLATIDAMTLPALRRGTFRPPDQLIALLSGK